MKRVLLLIVGILIIFALGNLYFSIKEKEVKSSLINTLASSLRNNSIHGVDVSGIDGSLKLTEGIKLSGNVENKETKERAYKIAKSIVGANVDNQIKIKDSKESRREEKSLKVSKAILTNSYFISVKKSANSVELNGYVDSLTEHKLLLKRVNELFGKDSVIDRLKESNNVPKSWHNDILFGLNKLKDIDSGEFYILDKKFKFSGLVRSKEQKERLIQELNSSLNSRYELDFNISFKDLNISKNRDKKAHSLDSKSLKKIVNFNSNEANKSLEVLNNEANRTESSLKIENNSSNVVALKSKSITNLGAIESNSSSLDSKTESIDLNKSKLICQRDFRELLSKNRIEFRYASAKIKQNSFKLLDKLVEIANECPNLKVVIKGYTDSHGKKSYNKRLSTERALAIKEYLIKKGVDANRLKAVGYGELSPIATNKTVEGRRANRRIEFDVEEVKR